MSYCDFLAGWSAGSLGFAFGYPLDTVKVQQQIHGSRSLSIIKQIWAHQKFRGFFRGMSLPVLVNGSINSVFFGSYGIAIAKMEHLRNVKYWAGLPEEADTSVKYGKDSGVTVEMHDISLSPEREPYHRTYGEKCFDTFMAGAFGGFIDLWIYAPIEIIKIQLQNEALLNKADCKYKNARQCIRHIYKYHGIRGFYHGNSAFSFREILSSAVYTMSYFMIKKKLEIKERAGVLNTMRLFLAGGFAGIISLLVIQPIEVIRVRMMADNIDKPIYKNALECGKAIWSEQKWVGFVRGSLPVAIRAFPVHGIIFLTYEFFKEKCNIAFDRFL